MKLGIKDIVKSEEISSHHLARSAVNPEKYTEEALGLMDKISRSFDKEYSKKMLTEQAKTKREEIVFRRGLKEGIKIGVKMAKTKLHTVLFN